MFLSKSSALNCAPGVLAAAAHVVEGVVRARLSRSQRAARGNHAAHYHALWAAAAAQVGAATSPGPGGTLEVALPSRTVLVRGTHCSVDTPEVLRLAGDKERVAQLLAEQGLPTPHGIVVDLLDLAAADEFLRATPGPCVVKPARDTAAGRGVTTGVRTSRDLRRAAAAAAAAGVRGTVATRTGGPARRIAALLAGLARVPLLVEHQVPGANYRLLYLDGELVDAIRREPPTVVGDGVRTIARLVADLNADRLRRGGGHGQVLVGHDLDLERTLADQGLDPRSVPLAGTVVRVKTAVNENAPDANFPVRDELCPELVEQGRRAAAAVGARLAGVDVITPDTSVPLEAAGGCVLEVNTTPGLAMHYHGHAGAADPATELLRRLARRSDEVAA